MLAVALVGVSTPTSSTSSLPGLLCLSIFLFLILAGASALRSEEWQGAREDALVSGQAYVRQVEHGLGALQESSPVRAAVGARLPDLWMDPRQPGTGAGSTGLAEVAIQVLDPEGETTPVRVTLHRAGPALDRAAAELRQGTVLQAPKPRLKDGSTDERAYFGQVQAGAYQVEIHGLPRMSVPM